MSRRLFFLFLAMLLVFFAVPQVHAQQDDDVLLVDVDDRLTSGRPNFDGTWSLGTRSYLGQFDSDYAVNDPGWNTLGSGSPALPAGAEAPPADTDLEWDFLPLKVDGFTSNLLFWDGSGTISLGQTPGEGYELFLQSNSLAVGMNGFIGVDGSPELVVGAVIDDTDDIGSIHRHRFWFLDDGDGDLGTEPADGVYLVSIRTRMEGLDRSRPLFFVFGTLGTNSATLDEVQQWVDGQIDDLSPDFSADFDGDLDVDDADLLTWQQGFGMNGNPALQISGDANFDDSIDGRDFLAWQRQAGVGLSTFAGASSTPIGATVSVPEPTVFAFLRLAFLTLLSARIR